MKIKKEKIKKIFKIINWKKLYKINYSNLPEENYKKLWRFFVDFVETRGFFHDQIIYIATYYKGNGRFKYIPQLLKEDDIKDKKNYIRISDKDFLKIREIIGE